MVILGVIFALTFAHRISYERPYLHWNFVPKNFTKNES